MVANGVPAIVRVPVFRNGTKQVREVDTAMTRSPFGLLWDCLRLWGVQDYVMESYASFEQ